MIHDRVGHPWVSVVACPHRVEKVGGHGGAAGDAVRDTSISLAVPQGDGDPCRSQLFYRSRCAGSGRSQGDELDLARTGLYQLLHPLRSWIEQCSLVVSPGVDQKRPFDVDSQGPSSGVLFPVTDPSCDGCDLLQKRWEGAGDQSREEGDCAVLCDRAGDLLEALGVGLTHTVASGTVDLQVDEPRQEGPGQPFGICSLLEGDSPYPGVFNRDLRPDGEGVAEDDSVGL